MLHTTPQIEKGSSTGIAHSDLGGHRQEAGLVALVAGGVDGRSTVGEDVEPHRRALAVGLLLPAQLQGTAKSEVKQ
jgi:hypothetical protein